MPRSLSLRGQTTDERREIARVADRGIVLFLLLQDRHRDFGEIVEDEEIDGAFVDEPYRRFEPIAPKPLPVGDANHKVSSASGVARGCCIAISTAIVRISRESFGSITASQCPRAAAYFASSQRS